jgi:tRNA threonylcarbamoyl adenosine modification protein (Sua5/YciO/YrdC/YwlC family)
MVEQAVAALRAGETVILPTDTVYGLCAAPEHAGRLAELKGRPGSMPVALLCAGVARLLELVPEAAGHEAVLPGPYTLILPNPTGRLPELGGGGTIGVRVPVLTGAAAEILGQVGAVAATSANRHGGADPRRLDDVPAELRRACAGEVDGGELPGVASTVVDLTGLEPRVLREGAVPAAEALRRLGGPAE